MTASQHSVTNKVILFGVVDTDRPRRTGNGEIKESKRPAIRSIRSAKGGRDYEVGVQVVGPYGSSFQLRVAAPAGVKGVSLLGEAKPGDILVFEGHLLRGQFIDRLFEHYDEDDATGGKVYSDLKLEVQQVRARTEADPDMATSSVWLEGTVNEPPVLLRHQTRPDVQLARVSIKTRVVKPGDGLIPSMPDTCDVMVVVPTDHDAAGYLYKAGNKVRIRGFVDVIDQRRRQRDVAEKMAELKLDWDEQRSKAVEDGNEYDLRRAGRSYLRRKENLERTGRLMVLATEIAPDASAELLTLDQARAAREVYDEEMTRTIRERNAQRRRRQTVDPAAPEPAPRPARARRNGAAKVQPVESQVEPSTEQPTELVVA